MTDTESPIPTDPNRGQNGFPPRYVDGSVFTDAEYATTTAYVREMYGDPEREPPGVIVTVMGRDGLTPDTFRGEVESVIGNSAFAVVEYKRTDPRTRFIGAATPGSAMYEQLIEIKALRSWGS